jgi:adenylylsulfate reductase subunit A
LKDEKGEYVARGTRNIKINGENIKTILADAVKKLDGVQVINHLNITDYIVRDNTMAGALGFDMRTGTAYEIRAKAVLCATGGAAGLYRPNNPGFSRHKMWYCPFNTGAGYAMGIRGGAEMTTFEMRFIALRCKDTIAPTGTIAQGVGAKQVNARGDVYEQKYGPDHVTAPCTARSGRNAWTATVPVISARKASRRPRTNRSSRPTSTWRRARL